MWMGVWVMGGNGGPIGYRVQTGGSNCGGGMTIGRDCKGGISVLRWPTWMSTLALFFFFLFFFHWSAESGNDKQFGAKTAVNRPMSVLGRFLSPRPPPQPQPGTDPTGPISWQRAAIAGPNACVDNTRSLVNIDHIFPMYAQSALEKARRCRHGYPSADRIRSACRDKYTGLPWRTYFFGIFCCTLIA